MEVSALGGVLFLATIIIGFIVCFHLACFIQKNVFKVKGEYDDSHSFKSVLISFIIIGACWFLVVGKAFDVKETMQYSYSYNIYALEDNMTIKGGRYYIEQNAMYYHMADYKDGKKMYAVDKDSSYIVEDEKSNPKIEVYKAVPVKETWYTKKIFTSRKKEYKIIVPKKTLTDSFNVDMK